MNPQGEGYSFGPERRLKTAGQFRKVFEARCSAADERLVVYALLNEQTLSRVGLSVGKKIGSAVQRNRSKRRLREAFRLRQHELPAGFDYVLIPRPAVPASVRLYELSLVHLCRKLQRKRQHQERGT